MLYSCLVAGPNDSESVGMGLDGSEVFPPAKMSVKAFSNCKFKFLLLNFFDPDTRSIQFHFLQLNDLYLYIAVRKFFHLYSSQ